MASHSSRSPLRSRVLRRGLASVAAGILASLIVVPILGWLPGLLAGWTAIAIVSVVWLLIVCWPMDATQTREHAISEDPGRAAARVIAVVGSVISLGAVVAVLVGSRGSTSNGVTTRRMPMARGAVSTSIRIRTPSIPTSATSRSVSA